MDDKEQEISEAIGFFEQVLQTNPNDTMTLEVLAGAYEQLGQKDKAKKTWLHLAVCVAEAGDSEQSAKVRPRLNPYMDDPAVIAVSKQLDVVSGFSLSPKKESPKKVAKPEKKAQSVEVNLDPIQMKMAATGEEVKLAWVLREGDFLNDSEYDQFAERLITASSTEGIPEIPISALCSYAESFPDKTNDAVLFLAERYGMVPLRLNTFTIHPEAKKLIPPVYVRIKGCFPFAKMGRVLQIAVLNPDDIKRQKELESISGMQCSFFLAHPGEIKTVMEEFPVEETAE